MSPDGRAERPRVINLVPQESQRRLESPLRDDYDEVVTKVSLPRQVTSAGRVVDRGYAVNIGAGDLWFFFHALLPALAFGRAARMSAQCGTYRVVEAASERRFDERLGADRRILHVTTEGLDRGPREKDQLLRWAKGVDVDSSHWTGPTGN